MLFQFFHRTKNKKKICVYCIAKNESKFVDRFMDSLEEIKNDVYVLDTGSTDNTVELFRKRGAKVQQKHYEKFEFDVARNDSLKIVPEYYDVCICLDVDEIISSGFIEVINKTWGKYTTQMEYLKNYVVDKNGNPIQQFMENKIHSRKNFEWIYPIHEILNYNGSQPSVIRTNDIIVTHLPDKTKERGFYLELLEERVKANPDDSRNILLLAREYNSYCKYEECIKYSQRYLELKQDYVPYNIWAKCYLANSYRGLKKYDEAEFWANKALEEPEITREPYLQKIIINFDKKDYQEVIKCGQEALNIVDYNKKVIESPSCWDGTIYDYMSIAYYYMKDYENAIKYVDLTIKQNPDLERLKENRKLFLDKKNQQEDSSLNS